MTTRTRNRFLLALCLMALALRIGAVLALHAWTQPRAMEHRSVAMNLISGQGFATTDFGYHGPSSVQSPPYPLLLAGLFHVFGPDAPAAYLAAMLLNCIAGTACVALTYFLARMMRAREAVAFTAAALVAIWPTQIYACTYAQAVVFITTGITAVMALFYLSVREGRVLPWIGFSLIGMLSALTEPVFLPVMAISGIIVLACRTPLSPRNRIRNGAILLVTALIVIGPWTVRNRMVHGQWIPIKSTFWVNMWKANNDHATGTDRLALSSDQELDLDSARFQIGDSVLRDPSNDGLHQYAALTPAQLQALWEKPEARREALFRSWTLAWLAAHPTSYLKLCGLRLLKTIWIDWDNPKSHSALYIISRLLILALTIAGTLNALYRRWSVRFPALVAGCCLLTYALTITAARFAIPFEPLQLCLGALALVTLYESVRSSWRHRRNGGRSPENSGGKKPADHTRSAHRPTVMATAHSAAGAQSIEVIVVNYRTAALAVDCLRSLESEWSLLPDLHVTVVDNNSQDLSVPHLEAAILANHWNNRVTLLALTENQGFAAGNNAAIRRALKSSNTPGYILLLNPDTCVRPGAVALLREFMTRHPHAGIAGSRLEDVNGLAQRSAFRFHSVLGELENGLKWGLVSHALRRRIVAPPPPAGEMPTDWVAGASMMVRRDVFDQIGLLDDKFFMYFEEVDFCRRAALAGWQTWYVPASRVIHLLGQSSGVTDPRRSHARRPAYWFTSRRRYFLKHNGMGATIFADLAWSLGYALFRIRSLARQRQHSGPAYLWRDFIKHNFFARATPADISACKGGDRRRSASAAG